MQFAVLGSGSKGNATLIKSGDTCLMVDNGFSVKETESRLGSLDCLGESVTAILVTHEHSDHSKGVGAFARKYKTPVIATRGTANNARFGKIDELVKLNTEQSFELGGIQVQSYPLPHDAREPCQFCFSDGNKKLAILTDAGCTTTHMENVISGANSILLECNHDSDMLWAGAYPQHLKERVAGRFGHLSNTQAAEFLSKLDLSCLQKLVAVHLSENNNTQSLVRKTLAKILDCDTDWIQIATQDEVLEWQDI